MKVEGGCFCQSVRYEAVVDPETVAICHCTDCQTHSGAAYGVVAVSYTHLTLPTILRV